MNKKIIGIPKLFEEDYTLWTSFFNNLGYKTIEDKNIKPKPLNFPQNCLTKMTFPQKVVLAYIKALKNKCDYILIPYNLKIPQITNIFSYNQILNYHSKDPYHPLEFINMFKLGLKLTKNPFKITKSILIAKSKRRASNKREQLLQTKMLKNSNPKILIVANKFTIYNNYLTKPIITKLKSKKIDILYADKLNPQIAKIYGSKLYTNQFQKYSKKLLGAIYYYQYAVDGIILITSTLPDDNISNLKELQQQINIPIKNIHFDNITSKYKLEKEITHFLNSLTRRNCQLHRKYN